MYGRTPYQVFTAGLPKAKQAAKEEPPKEDAAEATAPG
jgi:hypothetical protein